MSEKRNLGSSRTALWIGSFFGVIGVITAFTGTEFHWWHFIRRVVDPFSCFLFGALLVFWAFSKTWPANTRVGAFQRGQPKRQLSVESTSDPHDEHEKGSEWKLGFESVTMVVAVVTAVIAILTLTEAASKGDAEQNNAQAEKIGRREAVERIESAAVRIEAAEKAESAAIARAEAAAAKIESALKASKAKPVSPLRTHPQEQ